MSSEGIVKIIKHNNFFYLEVDGRLMIEPFHTQDEAREYAERNLKIVGEWNKPPAPRN